MCFPEFNRTDPGPGKPGSVYLIQALFMLTALQWSRVQYRRCTMTTSKKTRLLMLVSALIIGGYSLPSMAGQRDYSNDRHDRYEHRQDNRYHDRHEYRQDHRRHDRYDHGKYWKHSKYERHAWKYHGDRYRPYYYGARHHYHTGYYPQKYIDYHNDARYRISIDYIGR